MATCTVDGCSSVVVNKTRGWCNKHNLRWSRKRSLDKEPPSARYGAVHKRLLYERGRASEHPCTSCGQQAAHWAYDGLDPDEMTNPPGWRDREEGLVFSMDLDHYQPMCAKCHKRLDMKIAANRKQKEAV